ncbi:response regulator [Serinibacter salmoneus]|uniref:LuxR family two component transcriptional regulator n=1 Tax=Serinibacter salmoneus TaxID=556530 RepID=A0A2A9CVR1_9MICO|nr:response regulator transcription factor [Serinibacter salmoneus]PFG18504.1 LuxR family two component transcriptional regulator [Serinibacter salmoneus]
MSEGVTGSGGDAATAQPGAHEPRVVRVGIVDDDTMVRSLLRTIVTARGMEVVGEADDGDGAVDLVQRHHPDVLLMDLRMARMSGVEATRAVRALPSAPGVVALTSFDTPATIRDAVAAGVQGFLAKDVGPDELESALRQVAAGEGALSPRAARVVLEQARSEDEGARRRASARLAALSERERDVAERVTRGLSNPEIARELFLSESTVKTHLNAALTKSGAANRVQLAVLVTEGSWLT